MKLAQFFVQHRQEVFMLSWEHLWLVGVSVGLAILIGFPLGIMVTRRQKWQSSVFVVNNVIQTVPSLALFGLLLPLPWLGERADRLAIVALTLYALLPIIRNTYTGILGVDPAVRQAAIGMGLKDRELLWRIEVPLALKTIFAGVRLATVTTVGLATIAAAIGAGGLGEFIFRGLAMVDNRVILSGAIPAALLALVADGVIGVFEKIAGRRRYLQPSH